MEIGRFAFLAPFGGTYSGNVRWSS